MIVVAASFRRKPNQNRHFRNACSPFQNTAMHYGIDGTNPDVIRLSLSDTSPLWLYVTAENSILQKNPLIFWE